MAAPSNLRLAMVITADTASVKTATAETRKDVASIGAAASAAEPKMQALVSAATGLHIGAANSNASQAVARIGQSADDAAAKMQRLANAFAGVDRATSSVAARAADIAAYGAELDRMRAALDPLFAVQQRYAAKLAEITQAERTGAISASAAIDIRLRETATYNAQVAALDRLTVARKSAAQAMVDRQTIVPDRGADIAAALEDRHNIRAKYNPVYATLSAYKTAVAEIRDAQRVGNLSIEEMTAAITRQRQAALASIDAIKGRTVALREAANVKTVASPAQGGMYQTANIAAQFQDIGVTAAMGMSPIQIALQQGTQLSSVFATMGSGRQVVSGLVAALASLVSPISLVTIGLTAGAAAAIQYFSGLEWGGAKSAETLAREAELVATVAQRWGDALPALKAYNDEREKAEASRQTVEGLAVARSGTWDDLRAKISDINSAVVDMQAHVQSITGDPGRVDAIGNAFADLSKNINSGQATAADAKRVYDALMASFGGQYEEGVSALAKQFLSLVGAIEEASAKTKQLDADLAISLNKRHPSRGVYSGVDRSAEGPIIGPDKELPEFGPTIQRRPLIELDGDPGDRKDENAWKRALENGREQVEQMKLQAKTAGEAGVAADTLRFRLGLLQRATVDGKEATAEQVKEIDKLTAAYREAATAAAAGRIIADQERNLETLRAELSLVGAGEVARRRALSALQAEQTLKREGIAIESALGQQIKKNAELETERNLVLERQRAAWQQVRSAGENTIDTLFDKLSGGDFEGALESIAADWSKTLLTIGGANPLKNAMLGTNYGTLDDVSGLGGIVSKLFGGGDQTVGAMTVSAASVVVNGGIASGFGDAGGIVGKLTGATGSSSPANDNVGGSGAQLAWNFWKSKGLADHQVAGILGNIKAESNFNPLAVGDGGNAFGLFQHNDRRNNLFDAIGGRGNLADELAQHRFAYSELLGPESRAWKALLASKDVKGATAAFAGFERPSGFSWDNPETAHNFIGRLNGANDALSKFGGSTNAAADGLGVLGTGFDKFGTALSSAGTGGGSGGGLFGSLLGGLGKMLGGVDPGSALWAPNSTLGEFIGAFDSGGWTGPGEKYDVAGVVHADEFVFSKQATRALGVGTLNKLHQAALTGRGWANGGYSGSANVMPFPAFARVANANSQGSGAAGNGFSQVIHNYSGQQVRTEERDDGRGGRQQTLIIGDVFAQAIQQPGNAARNSIMSEFEGVRTRRIAR